MTIYDSMQTREIFHLEFLRWLTRKLKLVCHVLKGGANLRFFFDSLRYSEDMDLDVRSMPVGALKESVMQILKHPSFREILIPFGIDSVVPPDLRKAKQTETTQRFKVHLITKSGEDLFTRIEFSRRGFNGNVLVQSVSPAILRTYGLSPLLVAHYDAQSAVFQKIDALVKRTIVQPRDIFDIYLLSTRYNPDATVGGFNNRSKLKQACDNVLDVGFRQFRDTVLSYLPPDDRAIYDSTAAWDDIKLKVIAFIENL